MAASASVLTAATTLVEWAHQRRRRWTDEPLLVEPRTRIAEARQSHAIQQVPEVPEVLAVPEVSRVYDVPDVHEPPETPVFFTEHTPAQDVTPLQSFAESLELSQGTEAALLPDVPEVHEHVLEFQEIPEVSQASDAVEFLEPLAAATVDLSAPAHSGSPFASTAVHTDPAESEPSADAPASRRSGIGAGVLGVLRSSGSHALSLGKVMLHAGGKVGDVAGAALEGIGPWNDVALWCLTRGAALVSTASVVMLLTMHRSDLFSRWNRLTESVAAAAAATRPQPPPPLIFPAGSGRLIVTSSEENPQVVIDGKAFGPAPVKLFLTAGPHKLLVRGPKGSVERTVHVEAGETAELNEEIYPGWVAVASAVDLMFSENGRALKRDERGWAILPPGPHDIRLDNDLLGIHESRHVMITPGDATRISLAPPASTLSITTSEPAEVWIDGTSVGEAPIADAPMKLGMHDVRVRSTSHERWLRVRVTTQPAELNVNLSE